MTDPIPEPPAPASPWRLVRRGLTLALGRARFFLLVGGALLLIAYWPTLRTLWDRLTRPAPLADAISRDTEYWCPMCPGVLSDWPSKCPVCHMTLVRRQKGDMTPLPDGVVARVQLSPYRVQLAGIRTAPVEYRRLDQELTAAGLLEAPSQARLVLVATVFPRDAALLSPGLDAEIACDALPGETFAGRIVELEPTGREQKVRIAVENPGPALRAGQYATARFRVSAARQPTHRTAVMDRWRDRAAAELVGAGLGVADAPPGVAALTEAAVELALLEHGQVLAVPESAVIDTGSKQVVFVEQMPGMFDAVEIRLGRRCGDFYPVRGGLDAGRRVVTAGAVLLDAETRLNPSIAAGYFGAGTRPGASPTAPGSLSPEDRQLAVKQKICPVTEAPLDSMGGPARVLVNGKPVFICCEGCREPLLKNPGKYLPRLK